MNRNQSTARRRPLVAFFPNLQGEDPNQAQGTAETIDAAFHEAFRFLVAPDSAFTILVTVSAVRATSAGIVDHAAYLFVSGGKRISTGNFAPDAFTSLYSVEDVPAWDVQFVGAGADGVIEVKGDVVANNPPVKWTVDVRVIPARV